MASSDKAKVEILQVSRRVMQFVYVLPKKGRTSTMTERICLILMLINASILSCISLLHLIYNVSNHSITAEELMEGCAAAFTTTATLLIVCYMSFINESICDLLENLSNFSCFNPPKHTLRVNRVLNIITICWASFCLFFLLIYCFFKIGFPGDRCATNNQKFNRSDICGLLVQTWLPFPVSDRGFWIILITEICSFTPNLVTACCIVIFLVGCSEMIVLRLQHLKQLIKEAIATQDFDTCNERLKNCIKYHIRIINLSEEYNKCFYMYYFFFFLQNNPLISMIGFSFIIDPQFTTLLNLIGWTTGLAFTCVSGQRLIDESYSVCQVIYATKWNNMHVSQQKMILLMMLRAQRPLQHKAWGYANSSHITFTMVLKSSYSLIALLNTTRK